MNAGQLTDYLSDGEGALVDFDRVETVDGKATRASATYLPDFDLMLAALTPNQLRVKRCIDVAGATVGLVTTLPLIALLAFLVKLDSSGPVFFAQARLGIGGRRFMMLKLRTMRDGADDEKASMAHLNQSDDSRLFKIPDDPRVTRLGRTIRRWSLDELPQFYHVLTGDMSLIGPRPFFEEDLSKYEPHHFSRLVVRPGLTGLWQVSGRSEILDFEEVVRLDRDYIDNWSLAADLRILWRTLPAVLHRRGAY